jgi:hypothetical protein
MVKRIAAVAGGRLPVQVSLEERMACGLGACRSCVVPVLGNLSASAPQRSARPFPPTLDSSTPRLLGPSYKTVCRDGPVFYSSEIDWEHLDP